MYGIFSSGSSGQVPMKSMVLRPLFLWHLGPRSCVHRNSSVQTFGVSEFFHKLNLNLSNEFCRIWKWQIYGIPILKDFFWTESSPIFRICVDHLEHHEHTLQKEGGAARGMTLHTFALWSTTKIWLGNLDHWISFWSGVTLLWLLGTWLFVWKIYDDSIDVVFFHGSILIIDIDAVPIENYGCFPIDMLDCGKVFRNSIKW